MASSTNSNVTFVQKIDMILGTLDVVTRTAFLYLQYPFLSDLKVQPTLRREITRSWLRRFFDRLSDAQLQYAQPTSTAVYEKWIKTKADKGDAPVEVVTENIGEDGAKLHWVGRKDAKKVILHFHGGGFILTMSEAYVEIHNHIRREIKRRSGVEVRLAFLEYTLAPDSTYPTQFRQAILAVQKVLASGFSPADIVITGASAGGQLALQILSHIAHPHPSLPVLPISDVPFAGIYCMSPWVRFSSDAASFVNNDRDVVSPQLLTRWGQAIRKGTMLENEGAEPEGYWAEPLKAPPEWWRDASKVTHHVLVTYGGWEAFLDDNVAFVKRFKEGVVGTKIEVTSFEEPRGIHLGPFLEAPPGPSPGEHTKIIAGWIHDRLAAS